MNKLFSSSRYIILIAVLSAFIAALTLLVVAGIGTIQLVVRSFTQNLDGKSVKLLALSFIEIIDVLLLGTIFYITSLGLYEHLSMKTYLPLPGCISLKSMT